MRISVRTGDASDRERLPGGEVLWVYGCSREEENKMAMRKIWNESAVEKRANFRVNDKNAFVGQSFS